MPDIQLPDGSIKHYDRPVTVVEVAQDIGAGLARSAIAGELNGQMVDLSTPIEDHAQLNIITEQSEAGLEIIRHSTAHLLAMAVKSLFPEAQVTIGPVIENGFYYDFAYQRPFTPDDLERIQSKMEELAQKDYAIHRFTLPRDQAIDFFVQQGEQYKAEIIQSIPEDQTLSLYQQGDFVDLCRGPHVPSTGRLKAFKLMKVAGAYWRGEAKNEMLQRIYGTAWRNKKELKAYLNRLAEAEKRDHRKIGKALDLFHTQEEAPGMIFWHDKGWRIYIHLQNYIRQRLREHGYQEVHTPEIIDRSLWEKSGHWDKFGDMIFTTHSENRDYAIKPMNCPAHIQIYNQGIKSYRDLPLRLAEFGSCHRNEPSGTLHGLMRVRNFVQDDAHIFCTEDQILSEVSDFIDLLFLIYRDFGFEQVMIKLSTRPEKRVGSDALWNKAEKALQAALEHKGLDWELQPGEGAFYGPKIEFALRDCLDRIWQLGTIQLDFSMPERLGAHYVAEDNTKKVPVMLHRAVLGSLERFIGILIEHYAGALPTWLSPVHAVILNISQKQEDYARQVAQQIEKAGFLVETDLRNEKISFKIRQHTMQKVPYILVVGDQEMANHTVSVRTRGKKQSIILSVDAFNRQLKNEIESKIGGLP